MSGDDQHERFEELAAGHALGALEPEDEQAFLSHVDGCARCEADTLVHREALAHLAYAADDAEPPADVLDRIRAGIRASGREASFPSDLSSAPGAPWLDAPAEPGTVSMEGARRRRDAERLRRAGTWLGVAAAAALVIGLGAWNASLRSDRDAQDAWGGRMTAAVGELQDASTDTVPLAATESDGDVVAVALVRGSELSLVVDGLPVNDEGTSYVLWGQSRYGDVRPVGAFDVSTSGLDVHTGMQMQAGVSDVTRFMVSHEKGDGAPPLPQGPVLASGDL